MDDNRVEMVKGMVSEGNLQQKLYRYRPINEYLDDILINNRLWFSSPIDFNDPFDCNIDMETTSSPERIKQYISTNAPKGTSQEKIDVTIKKILDDPNILKELINSKSREILSKKGVVCFSKANDSLLEWAHYSDSHRGVCLTFDVMGDLTFFVTPLNVLYQKEYPIYNYLDEPNNLATKLIRTKFIDWRYEKEVRIIKNNNGYYTFDQKCITEIIFGWKTPHEQIARIIELAGKYNYNHLVFKRAILMKKQYGLEIIQYK